MLVVDFVANVLINNSIKTVFMYPGGTIAPLVNACLAVGIKVECFKSEQGAGYAALAYARLTGQPQVVMVTSGPGVTNVLSCLADAYYDSTPLILIAGQIGTGDLKVRRAVRQRGFQEAPTVELTRPISKRSTCMMSVEDVFREVPQAFTEALAQRKGPVVIDFPMDVQRSEIASIETLAPFVETKHPAANAMDASINQVIVDVGQAAMLAKRPVLLLGHGALDAAAYGQYAAIAGRLNALVVTSFLGLGSFDTLDPRYVGYVGHTGHLAANKAVFESDFLLVLGSRLDVRQTGTLVNQFVPNGKVVWVNLDSTELSNARINADWKIQLDVGEFCEEFLSNLQTDNPNVDGSWFSSILDAKNQGFEDRPNANIADLAPRDVLQSVRHAIGSSELTVTTGVGCHQHWAARHLNFHPVDCRLLTSGGHGAMGYDLPSAIGAAMALPGRRVLCVVGDGSFLMNIQELASLAERNLDVKILVMNNRRLGIVSQFQLITWGSDPTTGDFKTPDFVAISKGFGVAADRVENSLELNQKVEEFWSRPGPSLLEAMIDASADVSPMLLAGQTMGDMWMGRPS
ncbi:MAG: thiamine pyrophosphate-binding protein [Betaproteobacteria bacterium]|nr:thiamine pyrophosphate-binding protein [Betaproteobacteria bacterium]